MQGHAIFIGDNARPGVRRQQGVCKELAPFALEGSQWDNYVGIKSQD